MDYQKVFDTITQQLNLQTNPTVYSGFRNEYLPKFQEDYLKHSIWNILKENKILC